MVCLHPIEIPYLIQIGAVGIKNGVWWDRRNKAEVNVRSDYELKEDHWWVWILKEEANKIHNLSVDFLVSK